MMIEFSIEIYVLRFPERKKLFKQQCLYVCMFLLSLYGPNDSAKVPGLILLTFSHNLFYMPAKKVILTNYKNQLLFSPKISILSLKL